MYLRALEIQGFKSFPDKTRLTFEKDITAIVGPNGSGKSNISDAILWVMGEQRSKALRGSKMEDVIFGGTEKRNALGFAQVSLIIDNSAHIFDYEGSEVMLSRRYYRSGDSEYFINKESVRLKDIHSLLMDTGLGRDGYSIIGQGRIAEIVSSRSTDRREVFEEAAGISRFRYRKEEAERKLQRTDENLLRINDKIEELELQVGPLQKQAETAKRYLVLRDQLRVQEISVWMATLDRLRAQADSVQLEFSQAQQDLERAKASLEALYASSGSITERMHQKDVESEQARERLSATDAAAAACESEAAVLRANVQSSTEQLERLRRDIAERDRRAEEIRASIGEGESRIAEIEKELAALAQETAQNNNVLDGCRMKLKNREAMVEQLSQQATSLEVEGRSMDSRINMLSEMEKDYEGYSRAVKTVMREAQRGNLKGVHGPVANLLRADEECALAIETALGAAAQNIVIDTQNDGRQAIEMLKRMDAGRATFLPVDTIRGSVMKDAPERDPGFVGIAYELVRFDPRYDQIFANLLGRTVVAETLGDAVHMSKANGNRLRIVTLDGQMINAGGSMTGGSSARNTGILSRANELEKLKKQRARSAEQEKKCAAELAQARSGVAAVRYQLDMALEDQAELRSRSASFEAEWKTTKNSVQQFTLLLESLTGDSETQQRALEAAGRQIESFKSRLVEKEQQLTEIREKSAGIRAEIAEISQKKLELEGKRTRAEKETQERNAQILELERQAARIEQKKLAADLEEKQLLDKLWDNYELSHSAAAAVRQPVENLQKANKEIHDLRRQISALGTPNIGAIEEYDRVNTRYQFLSEQRDDVEKAKKELEEIIGEITGEMKEVFLTRFQEIDKCFRETFLELFGGGRAALALEDEDNVLECGIEIKAQPPGKALSNISLLSGGEMAFVAIALYFAILKVRPTPFCVMDEIEAALDEANVTRFAEYMRRMADKTQFLVITHRRGTMEEADLLYGVTMQEKGVSTVIELDLEEAQKTIEE
ncbi:MAG: AAA family ATPase [Oscillospiraceae bacterium]|nr:AAA family ATPase [Oscillospiraceae bacterium]MBQ9251001.1 AAA family ATPase [Oscillospiraceae bacterium]